MHDRSNFGLLIELPTALQTVNRNSELSTVDCGLFRP
jgi:hypothetical protein